MPLETLSMSAVSTPNAWTNVGGADKVASVASSDGDTSYIRSGATSGAAQQFEVSNPTSIATNDTINSVTIHVVAKRVVSQAASLTIAGVVGAAESSSTGISPANGTYGTHSHSMSARPQGGAWTLADVQNLEAKLAIGNTREVYVTQVTADVDYTAYVPPAESGALRRGNKLRSGTREAVR
jgi:hypothetical protein